MLKQLMDLGRRPRDPPISDGNRGLWGLPRWPETDALKIPDVAYALEGRFYEHSAGLTGSTPRRLDLVEQTLAELEEVIRATSDT